MVVLLLLIGLLFGLYCLMHCKITALTITSKILLIISLVSPTEGSVFGQTIITGRIISKDDTLSVPGVSVSVKNTKIGVQTNSKGIYTLSIPDSLKGQTIYLVVSFVGYQKIEQPVNLATYIEGESVDFSLGLSATSLGEVVVAGYGNHRDPTKRIPKFPWPPPDFTVTETINNFYFRNTNTLYDADAIICKALDRCGYDDKAYFYIPNGFAIVTRIEQIKENGVALDTPFRWNTQVKGYRHLSWQAYFNALVFPTKGYFRILVFAVTDDVFKTSGKQISKDKAQNWLREGTDELPAVLGRMKYGAGYRCIALIYEFKKEEARNPQLLQPGTLTGREHLSTAKILLSLNTH